ncbi:MAG: DUF2849 domain-containing protein [Geminicoccaceae bacterium]
MVTANRLIDGVVVFLGARDWVERLDQATVATTAEEIKALDALARQGMAVNEVVDAQLIDVTIEGGRLQSVTLRERTRTPGRSVRPDLGKQGVKVGGSHVPV